MKKLKLYLSFVLLLCNSICFGQYQYARQSNYRQKKISTRNAPIQLDTLSIVPGTFYIAGIASENYKIDEIDSKLYWKNSIAIDSVQIFYRVFDIKFNSVANHFDYNSIRNNFLSGTTVVTGTKKSTQSQNLFDFGNLQSSGSFGKGFSFGNNQDAVVNSTMNFQLSGFIGDSLQLTAAISDNNMPIQPEGNTSDINDFDKILIQLKKKQWEMNLGDIDIKQDQLEFMKFNKRIQGASFSNQSVIKPGMTLNSLFSGAIARGKFNRNIITPIEGNQGPYRLQGANNELYFIVLAASERVFIDGELMQRGMDQDYVIDYNTAEIRFTPKRIITKDKRIQVEFEYTDRNYLNSQWFTSNELKLGKKSTLVLAVYSNVDAKNTTIDQDLNTSQIALMSSLGDSIQQAFISNASVDSIATGKILYKRIDTTYNNNLHDSIFVQSNDPSVVLYSLNFTFVGIGKGNYKIIQNAANAKVYGWSQPLSNNQKTGDWEPVTFLTTPKSIQVYDAAFKHEFNSSTNINGEFAFSNNDINLFSAKDKSDDHGFSGKLALIKTINSIALFNAKHRLSSSLDLQLVKKTFRTIQRLRSVEFYRDWNLPMLNNPTSDERLIHAASTLRGEKGGYFNYEFSNFTRVKDYQGFRHLVSNHFNVKNWSYSGSLSYLSFDGAEKNGFFIRPNLSFSRMFKDMNNIVLGLNYLAENNRIFNTKTDSISLESYAFNSFGVFMHSDSTQLNKWSLAYFNRKDKLSFNDSLFVADQSDNFNVTLDLNKNEHHQLKVNAGYRQLKIEREYISKSKADKTLLGRTEYNFNEWNGLLSGNILYEIGGGQEQKKDFAFVAVPVGQGIYTWIDYNDNGIEELNEFEVAVFQDQKKYIKVFTPTNTFVKANSIQFNYVLDIQPEALLKNNTALLNNLLSRMMISSSVQLNKKSIANGSFLFNPFLDKLNDSNLISNSTMFSNSLYFNRNNTKFGVDVSQNKYSSKSLLSYGIEQNINSSWKTRIRINMNRNWLSNIDHTISTKQLRTDGYRFNNRNYLVHQYGLEPSISYNYKSIFRATVTGGYFNNSNKIDSMEKSESRSVTGKIKYNVFSKSTIELKFTYNKLFFDAYKGATNTTVGFLLLDGLQPGKNTIWNIDFTHRLMGNVEMNLQYEGRKSQQSSTINIGRASIRAIL